MKEKIITIKPKGISAKQWSNLLLELNLIKSAWKPYGVDLQISAPGIKTKDEKYKILWYKKLREAWAYGRFGTLDDDIPVERRGVDKDTSRIY